MIGNIEWIGKTSQKRETADVTFCECKNGRLNILFSNDAVLSQGRIAFNDEAGKQQTKGFYSYTDGSYSGTAEVVGARTAEPGLTQFSGTWFDENDGTEEEWYVIVDIYEIQQYTFTYEE